MMPTEGRESPDLWKRLVYIDPAPSLSSYYTVGSLDRNWNRREAATPAPPRAIPSAL